MATKCPVSRVEFDRLAKPVAVTIDGIAVTADVKEFSTGSLGWYANGKTDILIDGKKVSVQMGITLTIIGSKELPK